MGRRGLYKINVELDNPSEWKALCEKLTEYPDYKINFPEKGLIILPYCDETQAYDISLYIRRAVSCIQKGKHKTIPPEIKTDFINLDSEDTKRPEETEHGKPIKPILSLSVRNRKSGKKPRKVEYFSGDPYDVGHKIVDYLKVRRKEVTVIGNFNQGEFVFKRRGRPSEVRVFVSNIIKNYRDYI